MTDAARPTAAALRANDWAKQLLRNRKGHGGGPCLRRVLNHRQLQDVLEAVIVDRDREINAALAEERAAAAELLAAAREGAEAIGDELAAAGPEDVAGHPTLLGHQQTLGKLEAAIARAEKRLKS